jgi:hypothetical protein
MANRSKIASRKCRNQIQNLPDHRINLHKQTMQIESSFVLNLLMISTRRLPRLRRILQQPRGCDSSKIDLGVKPLATIQVLEGSSDVAPRLPLNHSGPRGLRRRGANASAPPSRRSRVVTSCPPRAHGPAQAVVRDHALPCQVAWKETTR